MHSSFVHWDGLADRMLCLFAVAKTSSWSSALVAITVRMRAFMFWMVSMLDMVSVGWQCAS